MRALLVIYSCKKYSFLKEYYLDKYTNLGYDVIYMIGNKNLSENYKYDATTQTLELKCEDNFESLTQKTCLLLQTFVDEFKEYDYIMKLDDDSEINVSCDDLMKSELFSADCNYFGAKKQIYEPSKLTTHFGKCSEESDLNLIPYELQEPIIFGAGYFYVLSKLSCNVILNQIMKKPEILQEYLYEDILVGKLLFNEKISFNEEFFRIVTTGLSRPRTNVSKNTPIQRVGKIKKMNVGMLKQIEEQLSMSENIQRERQMRNVLESNIHETRKQLNKNENPELSEQRRTVVNRPIGGRSIRKMKMR